MNIDILKMTLEDYEKIKDFLLTDFDDFWSNSILKSELTNPNCYYFVAKHDNTILGFGGISQILDEATINNIVVKKNFRNIGIASLILQHIIKFAISNNASSITLEVNISNTPAIHLYEKYNFTHVGTRKKYYNNKYDALLMTKKLN